MKLDTWQLIGFIFTIIFGTLLHFTYDLFYQNTVIALLSAVNESTWEHLKLLVTPMIIFSFLEFFTYGRHISNFIPIRVLSIIMGMTSIIVSFYTYVGILGTHYLWADIATFVIGCVCAYFFSYCFLDTDLFATTRNVNLSKIVLLLLLCAFVYFTFYPPKIALFQDPTQSHICE